MQYEPYAKFPHFMGKENWFLNKSFAYNVFTMLFLRNIAKEITKFHRTV